MAAYLSSTTPKDAVAYLNGSVYTINSSQPWVDAFIVSASGTFAAVGSTEDIRAQAKRDGLVTYDLRGQFIMPGIHDAHMHIMFAGLNALNDTELDPEITDTTKLAQRIAQGSCGCAYAHVYDDWMKASTFIIPGFDRECLDEEFPDTPVYITAGAGHSMYSNTALLKQAGYDVQNEPDH